jgi:hypothetical protein
MKYNNYFIKKLLNTNFKNLKYLYFFIYNFL